MSKIEMMLTRGSKFDPFQMVHDAGVHAVGQRPAADAGTIVGRSGCRRVRIHSLPSPFGGLQWGCRRRSHAKSQSVNVSSLFFFCLFFPLYIRYDKTHRKYLYAHKHTRRTAPSVAFICLVESMRCHQFVIGRSSFSLFLWRKRKRKNWKKTNIKI